MILRTETLVESTPKRVALTAGQAESLAEAGRRLAADSTWWGQTEDEPERSVIDCTPLGSGEWTVRVVDAIGIVVVGDVQLVVHPKIPLNHLLYLLEAGGYIPRVTSELGAADADTPLWRLVAQWFVGATEGVLRRDLLRDYHAEQDELLAVRGQVESLGTARAYYAGRLRFQCLYDEFGLDTPLNRVLKRAAQVVAGSPILGGDLRRRALRLAARMEDVGAFQEADLRAVTERRMHHYREAFGWARHVLLARGRTLFAARDDVWTFLIRTPEPVEAGIRAILQARFGARTIAKRGRQLEGSQLRIQPDLVVEDGGAVADVKYKLSGGEWNRPDLYQLVTFATGFRARRGAIISFRPPDRGALPRLRIGVVQVDHLPWPADQSLPAVVAARTFVELVEHWLRPGLSEAALPAAG